jgi:hypothetical protein
MTGTVFCGLSIVRIFLAAEEFPAALGAKRNRQSIGKIGITLWPRLSIG